MRTKLVHSLNTVPPHEPQLSACVSYCFSSAVHITMNKMFLPKFVGSWQVYKKKSNFKKLFERSHPCTFIPPTKKAEASSRCQQVICSIIVDLDATAVATFLFTLLRKWGIGSQDFVLLALRILSELGAAHVTAFFHCRDISEQAD